MTSSNDEGFVEVTPAEPGRIEEIAEEIKSEAGEAEKPKHGGRRAGSGRKKGSRNKRTEPDEPEEIVVTEADVIGYAALGGAVWKFGGRILGFRELSREEQIELGTALAPVGKKWLPILDQWQHEIALIVVLVSLAERTKVQRVAEPDHDGARAEVER